MRVSRGVWIVLAVAAAVAAVACVAALSPLLPWSRVGRIYWSGERYQRERQIAYDLAAQRPPAVRLGGARREPPPGSELPRPLVYGSTADYPSASVLNLAFTGLPRWREFSRRYTVGDSRAMRADMLEDLKQQARQLGLDHARLAQALAVIYGDRRNRREALLPAYAEHARYRGEPVWIVVLAWENDLAPGQRLAHIRVYAVSDRDNRIRFFQTCS